MTWPFGCGPTCTSGGMRARIGAGASATEGYPSIRFAPCRQLHGQSSSAVAGARPACAAATTRPDLVTSRVTCASGRRHRRPSTGWCKRGTRVPTSSSMQTCAGNAPRRSPSHSARAAAAGLEWPPNVHTQRRNGTLVPRNSSWWPPRGASTSREPRSRVVARLRALHGAHDSLGLRGGKRFSAPERISMIFGPTGVTAAGPTRRSSKRPRRDNH